MRINKEYTFVFLILCLSVFLTAVVLLGQEHLQHVQAEALRTQLSEMVQNSESVAPPTIDRFRPVPEEVPAPVILEQYRALTLQNGDMIGWIRIDGTAVDYPVMYTGDDFYLSHDFYKVDAKQGLPYIDKRCAIEPFGTNTIIYAHNMKNETMFSQLLNYKALDYYTAHPTIGFDTLYNVREYEIVSVFEGEVYQQRDTVFKHYNFLNADTKAEFEEYVAGIKGLSLYDTGVVPAYGDEFITLMTCSYHTENGRFVVIARKI